MNFSDEYKKEITDAMPDEQAMERIRRGVAEKLAAAPKRKPFPVRRTATICGSAAACLIIGVAAIALNPNRSNPNNFNGLSGGANTAADAPKPNNSDYAGNADEGNGIYGTDGGVPAGGADNTNTLDYNEDSVSDSGGATKTDGPLTESDDGYSGSSASENALIEIYDNGVTLTIDGTVTRFVIPADETQKAPLEFADSESGITAAESVSDSPPAADNSFVDGTTGVSENSNTAEPPGDSAMVGISSEPAAPETEFTKVIADNGEILLIQRDGDYLRLYSLDHELLGVFVEVK